jgi:PadR family transcriptional regulator, regulatory protein AphA
MSGYDLRQTIEASIGHMWSESYGQIYPNLRRLAAAGLVQRKPDGRKGKRDRQVYAITKKGRARLADWLALPAQPEIPRNEMLLKLFFGAQVAPGVSIAHVQRMAGQHRAVLEKFKRVKREAIDANPQYPDTPFWKMAVRYGQMEMETHLRWAAETLAELRKMASQKKRGALLLRTNDRSARCRKMKRGLERSTAADQRRSLLGDTSADFS